MFAEGSFPSELLKQQALKSLPGDPLLLLTVFPRPTISPARAETTYPGTLASALDL